MNREDMLAMLGLSDALPATKSGPESDPLAVSSTAGGGSAKPAANANAFVTDAWTDRRGRDLLAERLGDGALTTHDMADFHAALFDPKPQLLPACSDGKKREYLASLMETAEYKNLHRVTMTDVAATGVAAHRLADAYAPLKDKPPTRPEVDTPSGRKLARLKDEMAMDAAVFEALTEAAKETEEMAEAIAACGLGDGLLGGKTDPARVAALYKRIRKSNTLSKIMERSGAYRMVARSSQRTKLAHGHDEMVGITLDDDITRLIPAELASLVLDETELETLQRLIERQTMCWERKSAVPIGKGPVIHVVDESSSMYGEKVHEAKALSLSMAWIARKQNRWCGLIAYSGGTGHRLLALPPTGWDELALITWLEEFLSGGSDRDIPVVEMPEFYRQIGALPGITDITFITDALCRLTQRQIDDFNAWKKSVKAKLTTLVVGGHGVGTHIEAISDESYAIPRLDPHGKAVGRVLSI